MSKLCSTDRFIAGRAVCLLDMATPVQLRTRRELHT
jgi:hypothetical protein